MLPWWRTLLFGFNARISFVFIDSILKYFMSVLWKIPCKNNSKEWCYWKTKLLWSVGSPPPTLKLQLLNRCTQAYSHAHTAVFECCVCLRLSFVPFALSAVFIRRHVLCPHRKMTFGKVNELGQFIREAEPEPDVKKSKGMISSHLCLSLSLPPLPVRLLLSHYFLWVFALTLSFFISLLFAVRNIYSVPMNINLI